MDVLDDLMAPRSVLAISGSLRVRSFNSALLRAWAERTPAAIGVNLFPVDDVPLYNGDADGWTDDRQPPRTIRALRDEISRSDAVVLSCPEYNWGPSSVIKNIVDWASRPGGQSCLKRKAVGLIGVSTGPAGTGRAQLQLRQNLLAVGSHVLQEPVVQVGMAASRFDDDLKLVDADVGRLLAAHSRALLQWAELLRAAESRSTPDPARRRLSL